MGRMTILERECEWLRKRAYLICYSNADCKKVDKIIDEIAAGKINKSNLYDEIRKMTRRVTSDHSIKRWQVIAEWFDREPWMI